MYTTSHPSFSIKLVFKGVDLPWTCFPDDENKKVRKDRPDIDYNKVKNPTSDKSESA